MAITPPSCPIYTSSILFSFNVVHAITLSFSPSETSHTFCAFSGISIWFKNVTFAILCTPFSNRCPKNVTGTVFQFPPPKYSSSYSIIFCFNLFSPMANSVLSTALPFISQATSTLCSSSGAFITVNFNVPLLVVLPANGVVISKLFSTLKYSFPPVQLIVTLAS